MVSDTRSSTISGGQSPRHARHDADFYATPSEVTEALLRSPVGPALLLRPIWEPACGDGAISKVLIEHGANVVSTDLHDRGYGLGGVDFLRCSMPSRAVITNPPFDRAADFIRRACTRGQPVAMVLKATYWHAANRHDLFNDTRPAYIMPLLWRPAMAPDRGKSPTMEFMWVVWGAQPSPTCQYLPLPRPK
jgi:hypothetical protein